MFWRALVLAGTERRNTGAVESMGDGDSGGPAVDGQSGAMAG